MTTTNIVPTADKARLVEEELAKAEQLANEELAKQSKETPDGEVTPDETKVEPTGDETPTPDSVPEETSQIVDDKDKGEDAEVDISQLSVKAQKRFKQLSEKAKRSDDLEKELTRIKKAQEISFKEPPMPDLDDKDDKSDVLPWNASEDGPRKVTPEEYQKEVEKAAERGTRKILQNERILSNLRVDSTIIESKYPELNPENDSYNQVLVDKIGSWYKELFKTNKSLRLAQFVEDVMGLRKQGAEQGKAEVTKSLAKQAAEQAVDPSGTPSSQVNNLEEQIRNAKTPGELDALEKLLPHADK